MAYYLVQVSYSSASVKAMTQHPQDRTATVRKIIESAGGKLHQMFFAFGDFDVVLIAELPGHEAAAALSLAVGASGAIAKYRTTVLFTTKQAAEAMTLAGKLSYTPPK